MSRVGWRVGTIFLIFLLLVQFNNFGEIASNSSIQQNQEVTDVEERGIEIAPTSFDSAVEDPGFSWITGGSADWLIDTGTYNVGSSSIRSGDINNNQISWIETTIEAPALVSFDWRVSSEANYDYLRFYINGAQQSSISGFTSWEHRSISFLSWGIYTLRWSYTKDYSVSSYSDCGWIDNVLIQDIDYTVEAPDLIWSSGGDANWFITSSTYSNGGSSVQSGSISHNDNSWIEASVEGPAIVSFDWRVSSDSNYDYLRFYIDGTQQSAISGYTSWASQTYIVNTWGIHTLRWSYTKDYSVSRGSDCGWIDNLEIQRIDGVMEDPEVDWTSGGNANWLIDTGISSSGGSSMRSGDIGSLSSTWFQTTVQGPVAFSFDWRVSSEAGSDYLRFYIDGTEMSAISGTTSWSTRSYSISSWGSHTLRWTYSKGWIISQGSDCGWIDNLQIQDVDSTLESPDLTWGSGGDATWYRTSTASVGDSSYRSGSIGNLDDSWIETSVQGPGKITFDWRVSSESGNDYLRFYIDGVQQAAISGYVYWNTQSFVVNSWGTHTLRWTYSKGWFYSSGSDCGWIDNIKFNPFDDAIEIELPSAPQNAQATLDSDEVDLSWNAPAILGDSPFNGYNIYRGTSSGALSLYASVTGTSFTDTGIVETNDYYYQICAVNNVGKGPLTSELVVSIPDDDTTAPTIIWQYVGDKEDGSPGYISVTASDSSGLSVDPSGTYYLTSTLGDQNFEFTAVDADNDRPDDSLSTTVSVTINIHDDDTTAPTITWEYFGSYEDGDAGYIEVTASDDSGLSLDPSGTYYLSSDTGIQTFTFTAIDADDDRPNDKLNTTISVDIEIGDDDTTAPTITWEYFGSNTDGDPGYIQVTASDDSGLSVDPSGTYYLTSTLGTQSFEFTAVDADNDRTGDSLSTTISVSIDIEDDDTIAPEITWEYFGGYTDGEPGYIVVTAS
ncbi:MAG: fibronectin type III domain-containing protein, partial [Candidatus Thorarchaeota archaeon]